MLGGGSMAMETIVAVREARPADQVAGWVREVAQRFNPERIILFGSHARGTARPDSDVDILVVMDHQGSSLREALRLRQDVEYRFPLDLIVRSRDEIERRTALGDFFLRDVLREGQVLYERTYR